nr:efflux pump atb [Quercus suber]
MLLANTQFRPEVGPVIGGFINQYTNWRWSFWILVIWAGLEWLLIFLFVPETYAPVLLRRKAISLREETGDTRWKAPIEKMQKSVTKTVLWSCIRPFQLLIFEPMVLSLCLTSAILLGVLYLFFGGTLDRYQWLLHDIVWRSSEVIYADKAAVPIVFSVLFGTDGRDTAHSWSSVIRSTLLVRLPQTPLHDLASQQGSRCSGYRCMRNLATNGQAPCWASSHSRCHHSHSCSLSMGSDSEEYHVSPDPEESAQCMRWRTRSYRLQRAARHQILTATSTNSQFTSYQAIWIGSCCSTSGRVMSDIVIGTTPDLAGAAEARSAGAVPLSRHDRGLRVAMPGRLPRGLTDHVVLLCWGSVMTLVMILVPQGQVEEIDRTTGVEWSR